MHWWKVLLSFSTSLSPDTSVSAEERPPSGGDRKKWEAGLPLVLSVAQQTLEKTCISTIGELASSWMTCTSLWKWTVGTENMWVLFISVRANSGWSYKDGCASGGSSEEDVESESRLSGASSPSGGRASASHPAAGECLHLWERDSLPRLVLIQFSYSHHLRLDLVPYKRNKLVNLKALFK